MSDSEEGALELPFIEATFDFLQTLIHFEFEAGRESLVLQAYFGEEAMMRPDLEEILYGTTNKEEKELKQMPMQPLLTVMINLCIEFNKKKTAKLCIKLLKFTVYVLDRCSDVPLLVARNERVKRMVRTRFNEVMAIF